MISFLGEFFGVRIALGPCYWTYDEHFDSWATGCGDTWFALGTPADHGYSYCLSCGRPIEVDEMEADAPEPPNPLRAKVVARGDEEDV